MNKQKKSTWMGALVLAGWMVAMTGCEDAETASAALSLSPPDAELTGRGATQVFTASVTVEEEDVYLPLQWSVSNPSLGGILSSSGMSAVYESNGTIGQNVVICRDALGREGLAAVNQRRATTD